MKLLTRISSIRRTAWNACRSCSPDSDSKWPDSLASSREAGCTTSPRRSRNSATGDCVSHWISRSGRCSRIASAMARSRRTWPSPIGELRYSARGGRRVPVRRCTGAAAAPTARSTKLLMARLTGDGMTGHRQVAGALEDEVLPAGPADDALAPAERLAPVVGPLDHQHRLLDPAQEHLRLRGRGRVPLAPVLRQHHLPAGRAVELVDVLELLGGVRLGEHLVEEERRVLRPVVREVVAVPAVPPAVVVELLVEVPHAPRAGPRAAA